MENHIVQVELENDEMVEILDFMEQVEPVEPVEVFVKNLDDDLVEIDEMDIMVENDEFEEPIMP